MKTMDDYQAREYKNKQDLIEELKTKGDVPNQDLYIEEGDNGRADYRLIMRGEKYNFIINKQHKGEITLSVYPYKSYKNVDSYKAGEIRKSIFISNNMKAITPKKLSEKIAEEIKYHETMEDLNKDNADKVADFLGNIRASGENVRYTYTYEARESQDPSGINGGYIERNGLEYSFEISDNGYISQKIRTDYRNATSLATFQALADNKYKDND